MLDFDIMKTSEIKSCADLSAKAFQNYEYFSIFVANEKKRSRFLHTMLEIEFRLNQKISTIFTAKEDDHIVAVAMLCDPRYHKPTDMEYIRAGFWRCFLTDLSGVSAWNILEGKASAPCHQQTGSWYLSLLTIAPEFKGRGIGSEMLSGCVIPYVRENNGTSLCLFTNSEENRAFYRKNGFCEFHEQYFEHRGRKLGSWSYSRRV